MASHSRIVNMFKYLPIFILVVISSLTLKAQTYEVRRAIDPHYVADYDGGYGNMGPDILETLIINDSTVIRKMKSYYYDKIYLDTAQSAYIHEVIKKAGNCEGLKYYFVNITYCFLDPNAVLPDMGQKTDKKVKSKKSQSLMFFFVLGAFALYPLCRRMGQ